MPLASLSVCYNSTFVGNENLPVDNEYGVALEHLVSCIRGIQIVQVSQSNHNSKYLALLLSKYISTYYTVIKRRNFLIAIA